MKIGIKLSIIMIVLNLFGTGAVGVTLMLRAYSNISSLSNKEAASIAKEYAGEISEPFSEYWYTIETTAFVLEQYEKMAPQ
ncbi:MAG: hypothetical protein LBH42_00830, partial [Treponema sp.]|nr:hypothetical protein [Treponema sp.]